MSDGRIANGASPSPPQRPGHTFGWKAWQVLKTAQARLRFVAILVAVGLVIGNWAMLTAYWEKWNRPAAATPVSSADSEFFCPMHPQIVRDHPDNCPICGMPLSQRHKDEGRDEPLPPGVIRRVQLSPYRVALAGVKTTEVAYQPLHREVTTVGFVEFDERRQAQISARVKGRIDRLFVNVTGQMVHAGDSLASVYSPDLVTTVQNLLDARRSGNQELLASVRERLRLWGVGDDQVADMERTGRGITHVTIRAPISGHVIRKYQVEGKYVEEGTALYDVADLSTVWIQAQVYEDELGLLKEGERVRATTRAYPTRVFRGRVAFIFPHLDRATRTLTARFDIDNPDHELLPGMYATVKFQVPAFRSRLLTRPLRDDWRDAVAADLAIHDLLSPTGQGQGGGLWPLLEAAVREAVLRRGLVLTVPEAAVIDTGSRKMVYREASPGVFEGVEVQLGSRSGDVYPVVRGLEAGARVAAAGSFLIDAETRLNPASASSYFGASGGPREEHLPAVPTKPTAASDEDAKIQASLDQLSPEDRRLAEAQRFCAVLEGSRLGSMGPPVKLALPGGRFVFVCCSGCEDEAREHPAQALMHAEELKAKARGGR